MTIIEEVYQDREDLARVLKKHSGIRKIVEDLYPDSAHFIYELLQNAEDTGATEAKFTLTDTGIAFEHNGRPFDAKDIYAITDIGEGTKADDEDKIGRFGIGFKAVFAYTETPRVWSPTFAFEISDLVLPTELPAKPGLGEVTCFDFPFNNPKKSAADAFAEVEQGLNELSEATLLFLSHIESITWELPGKSKGEVLRIPHSEHHIEVLKQIEGKTTASSHYLRFTSPVTGLEKQRIAIAFALDVLPKVNSYDAKKPLAEQFKIAPEIPGRVAVFFPAEKETSGLRFHLHAPFVPELSRASIKETPANDPLIDQLATLAAKSLWDIRNLDLLTGDFLGVLPNPSDDIPDRYDGIRRAIVSEMKAHPLTPTYAKGHAPAKDLLQAKAGLKSLLSADDLEFLVSYEHKPPRWSIGATQKNSDVDRFLSGLEIREWDVNEFVEALEINTADDDWSEPEEDFLAWLAGKSDEWTQQFYAFLYRELEPEYDLGRLENLRIVRLSNGEYSLGNKCFFPTEEEEHDEVLPRVSKTIYTSGKSKSEQERAKKLLEETGVRHVGEAEQIEALLNQRYRDEEFDPKLEDIKRFIALVEQEPETASLFKDYWIIEGSDGDWCKPNQLYLDFPYLETGLTAYYEALGDLSDRVALAESYRDVGISFDRISKFAESVGVASHLGVTETTCRNNPQWDYLKSVPGERWTSPLDRDYTIAKLDELLNNPSGDLARLLWRTLRNLPRYPDYLQACYRKNQSWGSRYADSQFVHELRAAEWVPQRNGTFVKPADARRELLLDGFAFDAGWKWIKAIRFGEAVEKQNEEQRKRREVAQQLGFSDEASLDDAKWFAQLAPEDRQWYRADYESRQLTELPQQESSNPERRADRVREEASDAPERTVEKRIRSVSVTREAVKKDAEPYLRQQYTNSDGEMICQACKAVLPFKLSDGDYFFEKVEFLRELKSHHYQNYLALCPNHAAMFIHAHGSRDLMKELFLELVDNELEVVLAEENATIYFTKTHITDLRAVIHADDASEEGQE
jgi:hypothetical protein